MKRIILCLIVLLSIITCTDVNAEEASFYEGEYIPGEYIIKLRDGSGKYEHMKVFRRNTDNKPVYCLELWEGLNSNKNLNGVLFNSDYYSKIDSNKLEKVSLIAYYGYGYSNHTDIKWYAITQFMIWKELSPETDLYFTNTLNGSRINKYENEMSEILNLVNEHYKLPSFNNYIYSIHYNEWDVIRDNNKVLDNFEVVNNNEVEVIKENKLLRVKTKKQDNTKLELVNKDKFYSNDQIVYIDDTGQDLLLPGSYNPYYAYVNIRIDKGNLTVNKLDYDTKSNVSIDGCDLDGSVFQLLDRENNIIDTKEVVDGKAIFNNIGRGRYYLKEIKAGNGYKLNTLIKEINIENSEESVDYYNETIKVTLNVNNVDYDSNKPILSSGSKFIITNIKTKEEKELITNSNGQTESIILTIGSYQIKQLEVVDGYILNENIYDVVVNDNYKDLDNIVITVPNKKITSKIEVLKVIEYYFNDILKDTKIDNDINVKIYAKDDIYSKDGIKVYSKDQEVDNILYDGNKLLSKDLVLGDYYTYDLDNNIIDIKLDTTDIKRINLKEKIYEYDNYEVGDIKVVEVENTYTTKNIFEYTYFVLILLVCFLIYRGIKDE